MPQPQTMNSKEIVNATVPALRKAKLKYHEIANQLFRSESGIKKVMQRFRATGTTHNRKRTGRPTKITPVITQQIDCFMHENPRASLLEIVKHINGAVKADTVKKVLDQLGYEDHAPRVKP